MAKPTMATMDALIAFEETPYTSAAVDDAWFRIKGIRATPGFRIENQTNRSMGSKLIDSVQLLSETGAATIEGLQDYNATSLVYGSRIALPETTQPWNDVASAYQHVFTLDPSAPDDFATWTLLFGQSTRYTKLVGGAFNSVGIGVQRNALEFSSSFISKTPTLETSGWPASEDISNLLARPIPAASYDIYLNDTWATLGNTKLVSAYRGAITLGDKLTPDMTINSAITSYAELVEALEQDYAGELTVGWDSVAHGIFDAFKAGDQYAMRMKSVGPLIGINDPEGTPANVYYTHQIDMMITILSVGDFAASPSSPVVSMPFTFAITPDASNNALEATLINTFPFDTGD